MKINLTKEEIENFTCDVCGKKLCIFYYQNYWREIKGVCKNVILWMILISLEMLFVKVVGRKHFRILKKTVNQPRL